MGKRAFGKVKDIDGVVEAIRRNSRELKALKIRHIDVFGSFARDEQRASSDVDLLVEFFEPVGFFHFCDAKTFLEKILGRKVDLVVDDALRDEFRERIKKEMVRAS